MSPPVITPMTPEDIEEILPLERRSFNDPWTRRMYLADLTSNPMATYLVLRPDPADSASALPPVLGWGGFWLMVDEAHIATVASHPDLRGCGLGMYLMVALLDAAQARGAMLATLEVRESNTSAQQLYIKLGFTVAGRRRRYYRDGEDGLIMTTPQLTDIDLQWRLAVAREHARTRMAACLDGK